MRRKSMRFSRIAIIFATLGIVATGCATVHQSPAMDPEKLKVFNREDPANRESSQSSDPKTPLTIRDSVARVLQSCYDLEIPLFTPLLSKDSLEARLTSGTFLAKCGLDCKCSEAGAWGHGSETASGIITIELATVGGETTVNLRSMFWRTQSTGGQYGSTSNLYFDSLGRIERQVLDDLGAK
jgi:hypothetical protein